MFYYYVLLLYYIRHMSEKNKKLWTQFTGIEDTLTWSILSINQPNIYKGYDVAHLLKIQPHLKSSCTNFRIDNGGDRELGAVGPASNTAHCMIPVHYSSTDTHTLISLSILINTVTKATPSLQFITLIFNW